MTSGPIARAQINSLTGLRAVAALWVVLHHMEPEIVAALPFVKAVRPALAAGWLGVDIFFILSGFILSYTYLASFPSVRGATYARFLWMRLARVYPVHLFMLAAFVCAVMAAGVVGLTLNNEDKQTWPSLLRATLLLHAWVGEESAWNAPSWSISAEWFAYLLFPFIAVLLTRVRSPRMAFAGAIASFVVMVAVFAAFDFAGLTSRLALVRVTGEFVTGCCLYLMWRSGSAAGWRWSVLAPASLAGGIVLAGIFGMAEAPVVAGRELVERPLQVFTVPLFAVTIFGLAKMQGAFAGWLSSRALIFAGQVSYSLYMTHALCLIVLRKVLPIDEGSGFSPVLPVALLVYALILSVAAVLTYWIVEQPAREWLRLLPNARRVRRAPAPERVPGKGDIGAT